MVSIKAGCFQMGSKVGDPDELPVHEICISSFKLSKYEVRQKNYQAVMKVNPSENVGADHPVDSVSWLDARIIAKKWDFDCLVKPNGNMQPAEGHKQNFIGATK